MLLQFVRFVKLWDLKKENISYPHSNVLYVKLSAGLLMPMWCWKNVWNIAERNMALMNQY